MTFKVTKRVSEVDLESVSIRTPNKKDIITNMSKTTYNEEEEDIRSCCFCKKNFDTLSKFLKHVSHSKLCLEAYDQEVIEQLKTKSKLKSKRKWYHKNSGHEGNEKKKKTTAQEKSTEQAKPKKPSHATLKMKNSDGGRALHSLLLEIFGDFEKTARSKLKHFSEIDSISGVNSYAFDKAMDLVFNEYVESIFYILDDEKRQSVRSGTIKEMTEFEDDSFVMQKACNYLEKRFETAYENKQAESEKSWIDKTFFEISDGLFTYSWNDGICEYYNHDKFNEAIKKAQDIALDKIFFELIVTEGYFDECKSDGSLEFKMESAYRRILNEEFRNTADENGFASEFKDFVEKKWMRKFNKLNLNYYKYD